MSLSKAKAFRSALVPVPLFGQQHAVDFYSVEVISSWSRTKVSSHTTTPVHDVVNSKTYGGKTVVTSSEEAHMWVRTADGQEVLLAANSGCGVAVREGHRLVLAKLRAFDSVMAVKNMTTGEVGFDVRESLRPNGPIWLFGWGAALWVGFSLMAAVALGHIYGAVLAAIVTWMPAGIVMTLWASMSQKAAERPLGGFLKDQLRDLQPSDVGPSA